MARVVAGFILTPIPFSLAWGPVAMVVLPVMYLFEFVIALPLFYLFKKLGWLGWWHAAIVGFATAAVCVAFYWYGVNPYHIEIYGPSNALGILAIGVAGGVLFWAIAIFRNDAFPQRRVNWHTATFVVVTLTVGGYTYRHHLEATNEFGVVVNTPTQDAYITNLSVKLDNGEVITARVMRDTAVHLTKDRAVFLEARRSVLSSKRLFWVIGCRDKPLCR